MHSAVDDDRLHSFDGSGITVTTGGSKRQTGGVVGGGMGGGGGGPPRCTFISGLNALVKSSWLMGITFYCYQLFCHII